VTVSVRGPVCVFWYQERLKQWYWRWTELRRLIASSKGKPFDDGGSDADDKPSSMTLGVTSSAGAGIGCGDAIDGVYSGSPLPARSGDEHTNGALASDAHVSADTVVPVSSPAVTVSDPAAAAATTTTTTTTTTSEPTPTAAEASVAVPVAAGNECPGDATFIDTVMPSAAVTVTAEAAVPEAQPSVPESPAANVQYDVSAAGPAKPSLTPIDTHAQPVKPVPVSVSPVVTNGSLPHKATPSPATAGATATAGAGVGADDEYTEATEMDEAEEGLWSSLLDELPKKNPLKVRLQANRLDTIADGRCMHKVCSLRFTYPTPSMWMHLPMRTCSTSSTRIWHFGTVCWC
jgi:hypothetical protein